MANTTKSKVRQNSSASPASNAGIEAEVEESADEESDAEDTRVSAGAEDEEDAEGRALNAASTSNPRQPRLVQRGKGR